MISFRQVSGLVERPALATSTVVLTPSPYVRGSEALCEWLTDRLQVSFRAQRREAVEARDLSRAVLDPRDRDIRSMLVVRGDLRAVDHEILDRVRLRASLRVVLVGEPGDDLAEWASARRSHCVVRGPAEKDYGMWWASITSGQARYPAEGLVSTRDGSRVMEYLGADFVAAISVAKALVVTARVSEVGWPELRWFVSAHTPGGLAHALVFGGRGAMARAVVLGRYEALRELAGIERHLLRLWRLRMADPTGPAKAAKLEAAGVSPWMWRSRYRAVYATYTEARLLRRLKLVTETRERLRVGRSDGALERLVCGW